MQVITRFAPSPTGEFHIGSARTAIFNWLYARHFAGKFLLRIEDTDSHRSENLWREKILQSLDWLELDHDGEIFYQSQRQDIYQKYLAKISATSEVYEDAGALRLKQAQASVCVEDLVCGKVEVNLAHEPDITIQRSDGSFTFHFTNVVDDIDMGVTHVIRGEDHLSNTGKHLGLYRILGVKAPQFAHIPLTLNADGSKMSKRDRGATLSYFIENGFVPPAVFNYFCLLGWSPKDDSEKLSRAELISRFDISGINRSNAGFDLEKCQWLNSKYIAEMTAEDIYANFTKFFSPANEKFFTDVEQKKIIAGIELVKAKVKTIAEIPNWLKPIFGEMDSPDSELLTKFNKSTNSETLTTMHEKLSETSNANWQAEKIKAKITEVAEMLAIKPGKLFFPIRIATHGRNYGADLMPSLELMGRDKTLARLKTIKKLLN